MEHIGILAVVTLVLATYRLTRLVVSDWVPFGPLRERQKSRGTKLGELMGCPFCVSVWVGAGLAVGHGLADDAWGWLVFIGALALSGVISLLAALVPQSFE